MKYIFSPSNCVAFERLTWSSTTTCQSNLVQEMNLIMKCTCIELAELGALAGKVKFASLVPSRIVLHV